MSLRSMGWSIGENNGLKIERISDEHALYLRDESRSIGKADFIAFPSCDTDVREALAFARERGLPVTTQGGRTGLAAGAVPHSGLVLNLGRMDRIPGWERSGDALLLRVQPGVLLVNLRHPLCENSCRQPGGGLCAASEDLGLSESLRRRSGTDLAGLERCSGPAVQGVSPRGA